MALYPTSTKIKLYSVRYLVPVLQQLTLFQLYHVPALFSLYHSNSFDALSHSYYACIIKHCAQCSGPLYCGYTLGPTKDVVVQKFL